MLREQILSRRKATQADIPFLLELRRKTMSPHLAASGIDQTEEEHMVRVLAHYESAEILIQENRAVGLVKVVRDGLNWELLQVQLSPSIQSQGIGTTLLQQLVFEAHCANASLRLSVLKANPARRLYERLGFTVASEMAHALKMQCAPGSRPAAPQQR